MEKSLAKQWGMLLDQDVLEHLNNAFYLKNMVMMLQSKIDYILKMQSNADAKAQYANDPRVIAHLQQLKEGTL